MLLVFSHTLVWEKVRHTRWCACSVAFSHTAYWLAEINGAAFSAVEYPKLAKAYPTINCLIYVVSLFVAGMMGAG